MLYVDKTKYIHTLEDLSNYICKNSFFLLESYFFILTKESSENKFPFLKMFIGVFVL